MLRERAPEGLGVLDRSSAQHREVVTLLTDALVAVEAWRAEGDPASTGAAAAQTALDEGVRPHLGDEEAEVVPLADEHLSVAEWEGFTRYSVTHFTGDKVWLIWGPHPRADDPRPAPADARPDVGLGPGVLGVEGPPKVRRAGGRAPPDGTGRGVGGSRPRRHRLRCGCDADDVADSPVAEATLEGNAEAEHAAVGRHPSP